jgi:glycosyltransferase involved in cell wall biosynthesis
MSQLTSLSIIIPTRGEPSLTYTLLSIEHVAQCDGIIPEVIVVWTRSAKENMITDLQLKSFQPISVPLLSTVSIGAARNAGVRRASGEGLYFIDADCIILPGALHRASFCVARYHLSRGRIDFAGNGWIGSLDARMRYFRYNARPTVAYCPNLVVRRSIFESLGGFRQEFQYGSDGDFAFRATAAGIVCQFDPLLRAVHFGPESSKTVCSTWVNYGRGRYRRMKNSPLKVWAKSAVSRELFQRDEPWWYNVGVVAFHIARWYGYLLELLNNMFYQKIGLVFFVTTLILN